MPRDTHPTLDVANFAGLDNVNASQEVGFGSLKEAINVDLTRAGKPRRRSGQTQVTSDSYVAIGAEGKVVLALDSSGDVHQLDDAFAPIATYTQLNGLGPHNKLRINCILDNAIFSNGIAVGICNTTTAQQVVFDTSDFGDRTFDYSIPLPFNDVETFAGRNYYACNERVYYTPVFGYYKLRLGKDYFRFPDTVTMIAKVEDGLFIGTLDETFYLSDREPRKASLLKVANVGVIEGTKTYVEGSIVGDGSSTELLPIWATSTGFCVGLPNGQISRVTQKSVSLPKGSLGSAMYRSENGQNHIVSIIQT